MPPCPTSSGPHDSRTSLKLDITNFSAGMTPVALLLVDRAERLASGAPTLPAMSSRRRSSRVSLTSSSRTARDCFSLSKSATSNRSESHRSSEGCFNWMRARVRPAGRRAVDARSQNCPHLEYSLEYLGSTSRRACRCSRT